MVLNQALYRITVNYILNEITASKIGKLLKEKNCKKILSTNFNFTGKLTYKLITKLLPEALVRAACWISQ